MTAAEMEERGISQNVLTIYEEQVRECVCHKEPGENEYDDRELEMITMVMTLNKFGFGAQEIGDYFCLAQRGQETKKERIRMLTRQRRCILDEIHQKEKILGELDYLRHELS